MQLCFEGWDQALPLFLLTNLQRCQVLSLQMLRGETPSAEKPPQPTQKRLLSSARAVVVRGTLEHHLLIYVFTPSPSPALLQGSGAQRLDAGLALTCPWPDGAPASPSPTGSVTGGE